MGYDQPERSSSSGAIVAVLVVVLLVLLLGGLFVVGVGSFFYVRTAQVERQAVVELRRAEAELARVDAEAKAERLHAEAIAQVQRKSAAADASDSQPDLTVKVADDGSMSIDGEQIELPELRERLAQLKEETGTAVSVLVSVDPNCPAKYLQPVLAACNEVGHATIRVANTAESHPRPCHDS